MIAIVDYGMGNLRSVQKGLERVGASAQFITSAEEIERASKLVLPGVGAFGDAMDNLRRQGLVDPIIEFIQSGRPFLGICLGLQLLFDLSYEEGEYQGMGVVPGRVVRFDWNDLPAAKDLKIPHMGWNQVFWDSSCPLFHGLQSGDYFYFVHSYHVDPIDGGIHAARCNYGYDFTAAIWKNNVFAVQFHPEKSQRKGLKILENFASLKA
jgi:glutamine amidotransferase